ncbi:site-specific integrase [Lawsonibacter sp. JLR.KK007]|uniref:site-specific integrase n=1 Tax=Lawsonibacter sp. JLR.KK007 TaxID=3114293 RepID=UPI002FEED5E1
MATYTKRGNSYRIRASVGYTPEGKQVMKSRTWTPTPGMTERQIEKELTRQMVLFDEECRGSSLTDGHIKFEAFANQWFTEYVEKALGKKTQANYRQMAPRIYEGIGHLYMDKITPRQLQKFVNGMDGLSPKTIKNHLSLISSVFTYAVRMGMVQHNPCRAVTLPPLETGKEKACYTLEEAQAFLDALASAPLRWQVFFSLALFGGFRREELCGFEFDDFDMEQHTVSVRRASLYTKKDGIFTAPTKTAKSRRTLKLPAWIFDMVKQLRAEQITQRLALGDQWHECGRLFTKLDGSPISPEQPYKWLKRFCKENRLPFLGIHQFRHLNASLLIYTGEDVRSVSAALGHSQTSTTLNIYAHTFETAQARACDALAKALPVKFGKKRA